MNASTNTPGLRSLMQTSIRKLQSVVADVSLRLKFASVVGSLYGSTSLALFSQVR